MEFPKCTMLGVRTILKKKNGQIDDEESHFEKQKVGGDWRVGAISLSLELDS